MDFALKRHLVGACFVLAILISTLRAKSALCPDSSVINHL